MTKIILHETITKSESGESESWEYPSTFKLTEKKRQLLLKIVLDPPEFGSLLLLPACPLLLTSESLQLLRPKPPHLAKRSWAPGCSYGLPPDLFGRRGHRHSSQPWSFRVRTKSSRGTSTGVWNDSKEEGWWWSSRWWDCDDWDDGIVMESIKK